MDNQFFPDEDFFTRCMLYEFHKKNTDEEAYESFQDMLKFREYNKTYGPHWKKIDRSIVLKEFTRDKVGTLYDEWETEIYEDLEEKCYAEGGNEPVAFVELMIFNKNASKSAGNIGYNPMINSIKVLIGNDKLNIVYGSVGAKDEPNKMKVYTEKKKSATMTFMRHNDSCLIWHQDFAREVKPSKLNPKSVKYFHLATEDLAWIFRQETMDMYDELEFDIEPRNEVSFPTNVKPWTQFYKNLNENLKKHAHSICARSLSFKISSEFQNIYDSILRVCQKETIETLKFRVWNGEKRTMSLKHFSTFEQWTAAKNLDIQDENIVLDSKILTKFKVMYLERLEPKDALNLHRAFTADPKPTSRIIYVNRPYDTREINEYFRKNRIERYRRRDGSPDAFLIPTLSPFYMEFNRESSQMIVISHCEDS